MAAINSNLDNFYDTWLDQLHHMVLQLRSAPGGDSIHLARLVHWVVAHYADYYRVKSVAAHRDAVSLLAAPWATSLERSLYWVAEWWPTTLFHLVYTKSSVDILQDLGGTGDLCLLSQDLQDLGHFVSSLGF